MSDVELLALEASLPRLEARRTRRFLQLHPEVKVTADDLYDLVLAETESREAAERTAKEYMAAQLRRGETPA